MADDLEKEDLKMDHDRLVYHSLKEGGRPGVWFKVETRYLLSFVLISVVFDLI